MIGRTVTYLRAAGRRRLLRPARDGGAMDQRARRDQNGRDCHAVSLRQRLRLQIQAIADNLQPDGPEVFANSGRFIRQLGYCSAAQQETRAGGCASSKAHP